MKYKLIASLVLLCIIGTGSVYADEHKQYLQIMHEKQYKKEQPQVQTTQPQTTKPVSQTPKVVEKPYTPPVDNAECDKYIETALTQVNQNNLFAAQTSVTRALDINPNNIKALKIRGQIKNRLGDNIGALQDLNKAISLKPDGGSHYARGLVELAMQNYPEAEKDFCKALQFDPNDIEARFQRAYNYCLWGKVTKNKSHFAGALADFNKVIQVDPNNTEAYLYRGMAKAELKGANEGLPDIEYAMAQFRNKGDNNSYQRSLEIYNWIKQDY